MFKKTLLIALFAGSQFFVAACAHHSTEGCDACKKECSLDKKEGCKDCKGDCGMHKEHKEDKKDDAATTK